MAHYRITTALDGAHTVHVNDRDLTTEVAGIDITTRGRGNVPIVTLHCLAPVDIEGDGIIHLTRDATAADVQAELVDLLDALDPDELYATAMTDPDTTGGPAGMILRTIRSIVTGTQP